VPRGSHADWKAPADRSDPLRILAETDRGRVAALLPIRYGRMLASPFAFFRGAAAIMAADLAATPATGLHVQACGDAHLANFGGFATPERRLVFDVNDFDETLPGPWEWDLKRLVASIVVAGRDRALSAPDINAAAMATVGAYRDRIRTTAQLPLLDAWYYSMEVKHLLELLGDPEKRQWALSLVTKAATKAVQDDVVESVVTTTVDGHPVIKDAPPLIFHPRGPDERRLESATRVALAKYRTGLRSDSAALVTRYHLLDVAIKVVGVGSVGTRCVVMLLADDLGDLLVLQGKEARASVLEAYAGKSRYRNHGERVVAGQRLMQAASDIFLGWTSVGSRDYYLRQLRDGKIKAPIERVDAKMLSNYGMACGWVLAAAHARTGDTAQIAGYAGANDRLLETFATFGEHYADQNQRDFAEFKAAVRQGRIAVEKA